MKIWTNYKTTITVWSDQPWDAGRDIITLAHWVDNGDGVFLSTIKSEKIEDPLKTEDEEQIKALKEYNY